MWKNWDNEEIKSKVNKRSAENVLKLCYLNGGAYIKAGQYLATLNHMLSKEYTDVLSVLFNEAPSVSLDEIRPLFREDFGKEIEEMFQSFEEKPIAAASVAQVHKAVTKEGLEVAVKVQYPRVYRNFSGDMAAHKILLWAIASLFPSYDFKWLGPELEKALLAELDFNLEAENARLTKGHLKNRSDVFIPEPLKNYTSKRVLTTEFIYGCKPNDPKAIEEMGLSVYDVSRIICEAFSEQIYIHGFLHADPHPGNIIIRKVNGKPQVVIIDHGLYEILPDKTRKIWCEIWKYMVLNDEEKVKQKCKELGIDHYKVFVTMILMRSYDGANVGMSSKLSKKQIEEYSESLKKDIDKLVEIIHTVPLEVLLILRNNNLLRMINMDLGTPVNRFVIMARYASKGIYNEGDGSFWKSISSWKENISYELRLKVAQFVYFIVDLYARFMRMIGATQEFDYEELIESN